MNRLLVVGLGNPGVRYARTRHNAGFWTVSELASWHKITVRKPLFRSFRYGAAKLDQGMLSLAQPLTYMNRSGEVLPQLLKRAKVDVEQLLVVCDTLDLNPGVLRLKRSGSDAGHRGLASIISALGRSDFARLYVGIGRPRRKGAVPNYVLAEPEAHETEEYRKAVSNAADACYKLLSQPMDSVMHELRRAQ